MTPEDGAMTWTAACVALSVVSGVSALLALVVNGVRRSRGIETTIGLLTALAAIAALATSVCLMTAPISVSHWWLWCLAGILTLAAVAKDWSRSWMVGAAVVFLVGAVVVIGRHGYDDVRYRKAYEQAASLQETWAEVAALERNDAAAVAKLEAAVRTTAATVREKATDVAGPPGSTAATLSAAAAGLADAVSAGQPVPTDQYRRARAQVTSVDSNGVTELVTAVDALLAAQAAQRAPVSTAAVQISIRNAIGVVVSGGTTFANALLAVDLEVARYRERIDASDANTASLASAELAASKPIVTVDGTSWQDAIAAGPSAILAPTFGGDNLDEPRCDVPRPSPAPCAYDDALTTWIGGAGQLQPLVPGPLGWAAVGVLLLLLWLNLLATNGRQLPGPVSLPDSKDADALLSATRVAVLHNVTEPGATPGSAANNPVTDLLELAGIPVAGAVGLFLTKLVGITGKARGYAVTYEKRLAVAAPDAPTTSTKTATRVKTPPVSALFQVRNLVSGRVIATKMLTAVDDAELGTSGGLWAAGAVLGRSTRIPSWASWSPDTGAAIGQAQTATNLASLQKALQGAPSSGLLLVKVGNQLETEGRVVEAIEMYARAVTASPRYFVARYRLAASIGSLRHEAVRGRLPGGAACETATRWVARASAAQGRRGRTLPSLLIHPTGSSSAATMRQASGELLDTLAHDVARRRIVWSALRRSERTYLLGLLTRRGRARFSLVVEAARAAVTDGPITESLTRRVLSDAGGSGRPVTTWLARRLPGQVPRRLTPLSPGHRCRPPDASAVSLPVGPGDLRLELTAPPADRDAPTPGDAMDTLLLCLSRPGVEQLDSTWVQADPDLLPLRADQDVAPLFAYFVGALRKE